MKFETRGIVNEVFEEFLQPGAGLVGVEKDSALEPAGVLEVALAYYLRSILRYKVGFTPEKCPNHVEGLLELFVKVSKEKRGAKQNAKADSTPERLIVELKE